MARTKKEDNKKVGALSYKDLQRLNNQKFNSSTQEEWDSYLQTKANRRQGALRSNNTWGTTPVVSSTYANSNGEDYFGKSKYDPDIVSDEEFNDLNEIRANNQSWWDALGNGLVKMTGKALTTIAGTAGLVHGVGAVIGSAFDDEEGIEWSKIWNNSTFDALDKIDKAFEEQYKVYATQAEQNADWWSLDYLSSKKFWADSVITNIGFTLGAMATGSGAASVMGNTIKVIGKMSQLGKKVNAAVQLLSSCTAASGEAAIEAKEAYKTFKEGEEQRIIQKVTNDLDREYYDRQNAIVEEYQKNAGKQYIQTADGQFADRAFVKYQEQQKALEASYNGELQKRTKEALTNLEIEAKSVGNKTMALNQAILTFDNLIQFGKAYSKSFKNAAHIEEGANKIAQKNSISTTTDEAIKRAKNLNAKKASLKGGEQAAEQAKKNTEKATLEGLESTHTQNKYLGRTWAATKGLVVEGSEEMNQQWISSFSQAYHRKDDINDYWNDKYDKDKDDYDVAKFFASIAKGFSDSWGDLKQYEQFLVGAMMGLAGSPAASRMSTEERNKKSKLNPARYLGWEGGIYGELRDYNAQYKINKDRNEELNTLLKDPKFQSTVKTIADRLNHEVVISKIQKAQNEAAEKGDQAEYKNQEDKYFAHVINTFARAGKLNDLKAIYSYYAELDNEEVEALLKEDTENHKVTAEQDKKNYTANKIKEREELVKALNEEKRLAEESKKENNKEEEQYHTEQVQMYASAIDDINEAINNYQGKEHYSGSLFLDEKGQRRKGYETTEDVKKYFKKNSDSLLEKIDTYEKGVELIQNQFVGKLHNDQEDNLLYLWMRHMGSSNRVEKLWSSLVESKHFPKNITISKKETYKDKDGKEQTKTYKDAAELAESLGLDSSYIHEEEDGNFRINLKSINPDRAAAIISRVFGSQENVDLLNEQFDKTANSINSTDGFMEFINNIQKFHDALMCVTDSIEYRKTLEEYLRNPGAIEQKKEEAKEKANSKNNSERVKNKSRKELLEDEESGEAARAEKEDDLDDEAKSIINKAREIARAKRNINNQIDQLADTPNQAEAAKAVIAKKAAQAEDPDDLYGISEEEMASILNADGDIETASMEEIRIAQAMAAGMTFEEAKELVANNNRELIKKAIKEARAKKKIAGETPKTFSKSNTEGEETGVDSIDRAFSTLPQDDNNILLGTGHDEKGAYAIMARKHSSNGKNEEWRFKFVRFNKENKPYDTDGYIMLDDSNINVTLSNWFGHKNSKEHLVKIGNSKGKVKVFSIQVKDELGKRKTYVNTKQSAYKEVTEKKGKKEIKTRRKAFIFGTLKGISLDEILHRPKGNSSGISTTATPLTITTERNPTTVTRENHHFQNEQSKETAEQSSQSPYIKIATPQYYFHYRSAEMVGNFGKNDGILKDGETLIPMHVYFERKAAKLESSNKPSDKAKAADYRKKAERSKVLWEFLNEDGVFDRRNSSSPTGTITFGYSKKLNDALKTIGAPPALLAFDSNGNIIGDIVGPKDDTFSKYENAGIKLLYAKGEETLQNSEFDSNGILMIPEVSTSVRQHFIGTPNYGKTNHTLNEIMSERDGSGVPTEKPFKLGVSVGYGSSTKISIKPGSSVREAATKAEDAVHLPTSVEPKLGKPYLLVETSDPQRRLIPVAFLMSSFGKKNVHSSKLGQIIKEHFGKLKEALLSENSKTIVDWRDELAQLLVFEQNSKNNSTLYINNNNGTLGVSFKQNGETISASLENFESKSNEEIVEFLIDTFTSDDLQYPIAFNISRQYINSRGEFKGSGTDYNHVIGELAMTNMEPCSRRTVNDFVSFNPLEEKDGKLVEKKGGKPVENQRENPTNVASPAPKNVQIGWVKLVKIGNSADYRVCTKNGETIEETDDNAAELAAIYAAARTQTKDVIITPYGKGRPYNWKQKRFVTLYSKNPKVQKVIDSIYDLQQRVHKNETTETHYYIDNESGEKEEINRLHAAIDDHFGSQWDNSKTEKLEEQVDSTNRSILKDLENFKGTAKKRNERFLQSVSNYNSLLGKETVDRILTENGFKAESKNNYKELLEHLKHKLIDSKTGGHSYRSLRAGQAYDNQARHFFKTGMVDFNDTSVFTTAQLKAIQAGLQAFKDAHEGWTFIADNLVLKGNLNGQDVAGEVDLLGIDENGNIHVIDFKTSANPFVVNGQEHSKFSSIYSSAQNRSAKQQYTIQLSAYGNMIESMGDGVSVEGISILPTQFVYSNKGQGDSVTEVVVQPEITNMTYYKEVFNQPKDFFNKNSQSQSATSGFTNQEDLNKNEPKTAEERFAISSSLSGYGSEIVFGKKEKGSLALKVGDGRTKGRETPNKPVLYEKNGHWHIAFNDTSSSRSGALDVVFWRKPTQEEYKKIGEVLKSWENYKTYSDIAKAIDDILHGKGIPQKDAQNTSPSNGSQVTTKTMTVKGTSGSYTVTVENKVLSIKDLKVGDTFVIQGWDNPIHGSQATLIDESDEYYAVEIQGSGKIAVPKKASEGSYYDKFQNSLYKIAEKKESTTSSIKGLKASLLNAIPVGRPMNPLRKVISELSDDEVSFVEALNVVDKMLKEGNLGQLSQIKTKERLSKLGKSKARKATNDNTTIDINKEIEAVEKFIPGLSQSDALQIVESLIKCEDGEAYGTYLNGIITLARNGARGTLYHESFHYVVDKLLSVEEYSELFQQARERWGDKPDLELEELLAEDFREYMQLKETFLGRMKLAWRRLSHRVLAIFNNRVYFDNLYRQISQGGFTIANMFSYQKSTEYENRLQEIINNAPRDAEGNVLVYPNGPISNLYKQNPRAYAQVRTKEFKDWFGDWESESVSKSHGTEFKKDVSSFAPTEKSINRRSIALSNLHPNENSDEQVLLNAGYVKVGNLFVSPNFDKSILEMLPVELLSILEKSGVKVLSFGEGEHSAMSGGIKINNHSIGQIQFTSKNFKDRIAHNILHEIGHYLYSHYLSSSQKEVANTFTSPISFYVQNLMSGTLSSGASINEENFVEGFATYFHNKIFGKRSLATDIESNLVSLYRDLYAQFGNNSQVSKVVDENGEPKVMYHGTSSDFTIFKLGKKGKYGPGIYLTPNYEDALKYSSYEGGQQGSLNRTSAGRVMELFVNMRNPFGHSQEYYDKFKGHTILDIYEGHAENIDGIMQGGTIEASKELVVFSPDQVKSATDNIGSFDGNNPDIRYRKTEESVSDYHRNKLESYNLTKEQIQHIKDKGLTIEEYNDMMKQEKEVVFKC